MITRMFKSSLKTPRHLESSTLFAKVPPEETAGGVRMPKSAAWYQTKRTNLSPNGESWQIHILNS